MKKIFFILLMHSLVVFSQKNQKLKTFSFEEIEKLQQQNAKPLLVFVFTDWCKICFGMKQTTFKNEQVIKLLNEHFYVIFFDAENNKDVRFHNKTFRYQSSGKNGGIHELASILASINNQMVYPTTVILNNKQEIDAQIQGYVNSIIMLSVLEKYITITW